MTAERLPDCIVIGAPKCGTTTLCNALMRHPQIYMYPKKEIHYFNHHFDRGFDWYKGFFSDAKPGDIIMEGTPDYAMSNHVEQSMARMIALLPQVKVIFMVRDPIARIQSHFVQMISNTGRVMSPSAALERHPEIVETSDYMRIMQVLRHHLPQERILVLFLDDYAADKSATHRRVLQFLGADAGAGPVAAMDAQERSHTREGQGIDGRLLGWMRRQDWYDRVNMRLPRGFVTAGKRVLRRKIEVDEQLDPDLRAALTARLDPRWQAFQARYRQ
ncbi:MAG: sulfotransferase [Marinibacterium sp.]|nr:sulfotransferase [Marinibacterium sp.]